MAPFKNGKALGILALGLPALVLFLNAPSISASEQQARTLQELIGRYDTSRCKECHEEIYDQWEKSHHARSIMDIFMDRYLTKGVLAVKNPKEATRKNFPCFKCHFPQMEHASDRVAAQIAEAILNKDKETMKKLNIGCLVCHRDKGIVHGLPKSGMLYGTRNLKEHPDESFESVRESPILKRSVMCGQCHGLGPNLEFEHPVQCATLYGSYLNAYIPSGGTKTCQECHMENSDHLCPPNFQDRKDVSKKLARALTLDVGVLSYVSQITPLQFVPTVVVNTTITSRAGHRIPDGWPSKNRVVLEVTIDDDQGKRIYENRRIYMPQSTDGLDNVMVYGPTNKLGIIRDTSIQPFAEKKETFEASIPRGLQKLSVIVILNYQLRPGDVYPIHRDTIGVSMRTK